MLRNCGAEIALSLEHPGVAHSGSLQPCVWGRRLEKGFYKRNPVAPRELHEFMLAQGMFRGLKSALDEEFRQRAALNFSGLLA